MARQTNTVAQIRRDAAESLRHYLSVPQEERTAILRTVADLFVDAREHFYTADGTPDWRGRSYAYRRWVSDAYSDANLPREELATIQAAIRYHVGNVLRDRLSPEELEGLGLRAVGPRERSVEKRAKYAELLARFQGGPIEDVEEARDAVLAAWNLLSRVNLATIEEAPAAERKAARAVLDDLSAKVAEMEKAAGKRR